MNPEEQRIAIAKACGWTDIHVDNETLEGFPVLCGIKPKIGVEQAVPDYLNDLNAMHEAEMLLDDNRWTIPGTIIKGSLALYDAYVSELSQRFGRSVRATAAERAESFLRTLNLWKD